MRLYKDTSISVQETEDGEPAAFRFQGRTYRVATIEEIREPRLDWWSPLGEIHRLYFLLVTERGMICEIFRDQVAGDWWMARVYD